MRGRHVTMQLNICMRYNRVNITSRLRRQNIYIYYESLYNICVTKLQSDKYVECSGSWSECAVPSAVKPQMVVGSRACKTWFERCTHVIWVRQPQPLCSRKLTHGLQTLTCLCRVDQNHPLPVIMIICNLIWTATDISQTNNINSLTTNMTKAIYDSYKVWVNAI